MFRGSEFVGAELGAEIIEPCKSNTNIPCSRTLGMKAVQNIVARASSDMC